MNNLQFLGEIGCIGLVVSGLNMHFIWLEIKSKNSFKQRHNWNISSCTHQNKTQEWTDQTKIIQYNVARGKQSAQKYMWRSWVLYLQLHTRERNGIGTLPKKWMNMVCLNESDDRDICLEKLFCTKRYISARFIIIMLVIFSTLGW